MTDAGKKSLRNMNEKEKVQNLSQNGCFSFCAFSIKRSDVAMSRPSLVPFFPKVVVCFFPKFDLFSVHT